MTVFVEQPLALPGSANYKFGSLLRETCLKHSFDPMENFFLQIQYIEWNELKPYSVVEILK